MARFTREYRPNNCLTKTRGITEGPRSCSPGAEVIPLISGHATEEWEIRNLLILPSRGSLGNFYDSDSSRSASMLDNDSISIVIEHLFNQMARGMFSSHSILHFGNTRSWRRMWFSWFLAARSRDIHISVTIRLQMSTISSARELRAISSSILWKIKKKKKEGRRRKAIINNRGDARDFTFDVSQQITGQRGN